jgi:hypothetical protein
MLVTVMNLRTVPQVSPHTLMYSDDIIAKIDGKMVALKLEQMYTKYLCFAFQKNSGMLDANTQ